MRSLGAPVVVQLATDWEEERAILLQVVVAVRVQLIGTIERSVLCDHLRAGVKLLPSTPGHFDDRHHGKRNAVARAAACATQHLRPQRLTKTPPVVHDQVRLEKQTRDPELGARHGTPVKGQARTRERAVRDREGRGRSVQVHDLVPPQDVERNGYRLALEDQTDDSVVLAQIPGARLTGQSHLGVGERRDAVLAGPAEDLFLRDAARLVVDRQSAAPAAPAAPAESGDHARGVTAAGGQRPDGCKGEERRPAAR